MSVEVDPQGDDHPAVVMADGSARLTYGALERRSVKLARYLRAAGLVDGDRIAILMENRIDWIVAMWAARRASLLFVPVNWHLKPAEVRYVVENSDARAVVTSEALLDVAREATEGLSEVMLRLTTGPSDQGFENLEDAVADQPETAPADERDGALMPYSSGTSGRPKGILRALELSPFGTPTRLEAMLAELYGLDGDTIYLSTAPLYHASPVTWANTVLVHHGTIVVMASFQPDAAMAAIPRWKITHAQYVPTHFVRMLKLPDEVRQTYDLSSLKVAVHAAAPCAPDVKRRMIDWFGPRIFEYYSGSERCGFTAIDTPQWLAHPGSVGLTHTGAIHIVDPETGDEASTGETGLIYFENAVRFDYHKQPGKTAEVLNAQGWGTHGDIGRVDADGFLYLADRLSHMIISGGVNIYPQETENALAEHPAVADVAVIGVPNEEFGEEVKAVIQLDRASGVAPPDPAELIAFCKARIAGYKCPRSIDFVDELPRHPNGKLLKRDLRARYWPTDARL